MSRGLHVGFRAADCAQVNALWQAGLDAGYRDAGAPGPRPQYGAAYYGGLLLDHDEQAARVCRALLDAAAAFSNQLPEVFAGFARDEADMPVEYPEALKPQSWAAGAPLLALRTLLGLDVAGDDVRGNPCLPAGIARLHLRKLGARSRHFDI